MILILLQGGLGNQLFQLSLASLLKSKYTSQKVVVEHRTGFLLDFHYRRSFEVSELCSLLKISKAGYILSLLAFLYRLTNKAFGASVLSLLIYSYDDTTLPSQALLDGTAFQDTRQLYLLSGWFQDVRYVIRSDLPHALYTYLNNLYYPELLPGLLRSKVTRIAACLRLYEEAHDLQSHTRSGLPPSIILFKNIVAKLVRVSPHSTSLFCVGQSRYPQFNCLSQYEPIFWTGEDGVRSPYFCIYAISLANRAVITSSTLYFWGAYMLCIRNNLARADVNTPMVYYSSDSMIKSTDLLGWYSY
jgi:hypothetical protein